MYLPTSIGHEVVNGDTIGRDPRTMIADDLISMGHNPVPILDSIRAKCVDCCGGSPSEARKCVAVRCPLWPYRTGANPFRVKRALSDDQKAALKERLQGSKSQ